MLAGAKNKIIIIIITIIITWNEKAVEFIFEVERRRTEVTNDQQETMFLFQRISVALQRGNAIAFRNTFSFEH